MILRRTKIIIFFIIGFIVSCNRQDKEQGEPVALWKTYEDSALIAANADHEIERMRYKLIQSKVLDKNTVFQPLHAQVAQFSAATYNALKPLILEQDIPTLQAYIAEGQLSYEKLTLFFLYRIYKYELAHETTLNTILALNQAVVQQAKQRDAELINAPDAKRHPIFGMPILLKDNINAAGMKTTAGAIAFIDNETDDSFITRQLKNHGALILGKVNLSEWAYFLCSGCPVGYSAVGGQTLNPYGRGIFETGGSSAGSGTSVAANYAVAAIGTETSGSILSPSSQNSVVGLKPTVGLLSRSGIVPISSTLDTPGPMTKNVIDNAILLSALKGKDNNDAASVITNKDFLHILNDPSIALKGKRFGVFATLLAQDSIYNSTVEIMRSAGAEIIPFTPPEVALDGFINILNIDMRNDLPKYIKTQVKNKSAIKIKSIKNAVAYNNADSLLRIPYGQALFEGILADSTSVEELQQIKTNLEKNSRKYFDTALKAKELDAILSINNYHAGYAAVAKYPALTVPMGYKPSGEPISLTFIAPAFHESQLLRLGKAFEAVTKARRIPEAFQD